MLSEQLSAKEPLLSVANTYELSIRLWSDGLSFLRQQHQAGSSQEGEYRYLPFEAGHADYVTAAKELFFRYEELTLPYKSVKIYYNPFSLVLMPQALYEEGRGDYWLRSAVMPPVGRERIVLEKHLTNQDKILLLDWDKALHDFIRRTHIASTFIPSYAALLQENERQSRLQPGNCVAVEVSRQSIAVFVFKSGQLRFANVFPLTPAESDSLADELLFYLISVWNCLGLNSEEDQVKIYMPPSFELDVDKTLIASALNPFFRNLDFKMQEQV